MRLSLLGLFAAIVLALAGCAEPPKEVPSVEEPPVVVSNAPVEIEREVRGTKKLSDTVQVGKQAPDFEVIDEKGKKWKLSDYKGKVVLLDFWGFWCPTCVDELPELKQYTQELKGQDFVMIGMNTDTDYEQKELIEKLAQSPASWRQGLLGDDHKLFKDYAVRSFPTKVMVNKTGEIVFIDHFIQIEDIKKHL